MRAISIFSMRNLINKQTMYKKSEPVLFDENVKMSDVILTNSLLLHVLPHFGIVNCGWNNKTIQEVCNESNVSIPLFLLICNLYTFEGYDFVTRQALEKISIEEILGYLRKSHQTILSQRLLEVRVFAKFLVPKLV